MRCSLLLFCNAPSDSLTRWDGDGKEPPAGWRGAEDVRQNISRAVSVNLEGRDWVCEWRVEMEMDAQINGFRELFSVWRGDEGEAALIRAATNPIDISVIKLN